MMADSAIAQGNRNVLVKQKMLNFVMNHPSDLVSVSELWVGLDEQSGEWRVVLPDDIGVDDGGDVVVSKLEAFEAKMEQRAAERPDLYMRVTDGADVPYRVAGDAKLHQHQVVVKRGGRDYVLTVNGNPRLAQALNGATNPDSNLSGAVGKIVEAMDTLKRWLSMVFTSLSPNFMASNLLRDTIYSHTMVHAKEGSNYALAYHKNALRTTPVHMAVLIGRYKAGKLDMGKGLERAFSEFMLNGGETGYISIREIDAHKREVKKVLRRLNGGRKLLGAWDDFLEGLDFFNRSVEIGSRFAAYLTSREMGRSVGRSVYDAKEITVNFNKKGAGATFLGAHGQTMLGDISAFVSGFGRTFYVFWNAAVQGTTNFGRAFKRSPIKAGSGALSIVALGLGMSFVNRVLSGGSGDDDKNKYENLPRFVRRNNLLFGVPGMESWVSLPLPQEYKSLYGMGELLGSLMQGEDLESGEVAREVAENLCNFLPVDPMEGSGGWVAVAPSSVKPLIETGRNEKWTGMPIYKDTTQDKPKPEWTKAFSSANRELVGAARWLNEATGGDDIKGGFIDLNPAMAEYLLTSYLGGIATFVNQSVKTAEMAAGAREVNVNEMPVVSRFLKAGDELSAYRALNAQYYKLADEYRETKRLLRGYKGKSANGAMGYAERLHFLEQSREYGRFLVMDEYIGAISAMERDLREAKKDEDEGLAKKIEAYLWKKKGEMVEKVKVVGK